MDIPEGLSPEELSNMMESNDMRTFMIACEALCLDNTNQAYEILKRYIVHNDLYKRRYVLSVIFGYPQAAELVPHLEWALGSEKAFLWGTALDVIIQQEIRVAEEVLFSCIERNWTQVRRYDIYALNSVEKTQANAQRILKLYHACRDDSTRIAIAEVLYDFCAEENHLTFYELFQDDPTPHIRILACRIARAYHRPDLLSKFAQDRNGHIRKLALDA
jgi:hypothetical protein